MRFVVAVIALCSVLLSAQSALADKRVALVIGNSSYRFVARVPTAVADARLLAGRLRDAGFEVFEGIDLTREQLAARLGEFTVRARGADIALFSYSGHAVALFGRNYLLPVDVNPESEMQVVIESIDLEIALDTMAGAATRLAFVDASSDDPLRTKIRVSATRSGPQRGLDRISARAGTLIAFATSPGKTAADGDGSGNSPFAQALAANIAEPGVDIEQAMTKVRARVSETTAQRQLPWVNSALIGTVYLRGSTTVPPPVVQSGDAIKRAEEERRLAQEASLLESKRKELEAGREAEARRQAEARRREAEAARRQVAEAQARKQAEEREQRMRAEDILAALRSDRATRSSEPSLATVPTPADPASEFLSLPEFPSPIPAASASYVLPEALLKQNRTVGDAVTTILGALERTGYVERTFFRTRAGGVALVTRLEKIDQDGAPLVERERWGVADRSYDSAADLMNFFRGLFFADRGRYRLIVFILQETPFVADGKKLSEKEARSLMKRGANVLSTAAANREFAGHHCTVLIYEFASDGRTVRLVENSRLSGRQHLDKAGVLALIGKLN